MRVGVGVEVGVWGEAGVGVEPGGGGVIERNRVGVAVMSDVGPAIGVASPCTQAVSSPTPNIAIAIQHDRMGAF